MGEAPETLEALDFAADSSAAAADDDEAAKETKLADEAAKATKPSLETVMIRAFVDRGMRVVVETTLDGYPPYDPEAIEAEETFLTEEGAARAYAALYALGDEEDAGRTRARERSGGVHENENENYERSTRTRTKHSNSNEALELERSTSNSNARLNDALPPSLLLRVRHLQGDEAAVVPLVASVSAEARLRDPHPVLFASRRERAEHRPVSHRADDAAPTRGSSPSAAR